MPNTFTAVVEGSSDKTVVEAICRHLKIDSPKIVVKNGKGALDRDLDKYNKAARHFPFLVIRDLNHDAECAPDLRKRLMPKSSRLMVICIVIHEIEAWLMADSEKLSEFLGISQKHIPQLPEQLDDPKSAMLKFVEKSRNREIREEMLPRKNSGAKQGPAYTSRIMEFASLHWRPDVASMKCPSLERCLKKIEQISKA